MNRLFITGTGTDVGKTIVTALMTHRLNEKTAQFFPYKPIETGIGKVSNEIALSDEAIYKMVFKDSLHSHCTYYLKHSYSPHLAAKLENKVINIQLLKQKINEIEEHYGGIIIEGAGGLFVPIEEDGYCMIHFIKELYTPTILVANAGLGTINHTILSILALQSKNIPLVGVIFNFAKKNNELENDNIYMIQKMTGIPVIGTVPFTKNINSSLLSKEKRELLTKDWNIDLIKKSSKLECDFNEYRTINENK